MNHPPDARVPPIEDRRGKPDRRTSERRHLQLVPPVEQRSHSSRRTLPDRRVGSGAATAEEAVRTALQLLITITETEMLDDDLQRHLDTAIVRLHFAIEHLQRGA